MSELNIPDHWAEVEFEKIVSDPKSGFKRGPFGSALKKEFFVPEGYKVYEQKHAIRGDHSLGTYCIDEKKFQELKGFEVKPGDFLVSCSGTLGKIYQIPAEAKQGIINQALLRLRINSDLIKEDFFKMYFSSKSFQSLPFEAAPGSAQVNMVGVGELKKFPFPIPPKDEQERIVQKIKSCFQKIDETEKALNEVEVLLTKYRESLLAKAFSGELIPQDPKDEPASKLLEKIRAERAKNSNGKKALEFAPILDNEKPFDLPETWAWVRLGEIAKKVTDGAHHTPKPVTEGIPYILAKQIKDQGINFDECLYLSEIEHKKIYDRANIEFGDLLITNIGAGTGTATIVNVDFQFSIKNIALVKLMNQFTLSKYILYYFRFFRKRIFDEFARGGAQPFISLNLLSNLIIPLAPFKEQERIVEMIENNFLKIDQFREISKEQFGVISKLHESILAQAFEGRLVERINFEGTGHELIVKIQENNKKLGEELETKLSSKMSKKTVKKKVKK